MKSSFWTLAAVALLFAGCSKEEITENVSEGGSLVATPTNGLARLGRASNQPSVKFKNSRIVIGLNNTKTDEDVPLDAILAEGGGSLVLIDNETTPPTVIELPLENTNGNENQRYRTPQFELPSELEFDLFDIEIRGADGVYLWGASIFVREDGRAVENNPVLAKFRRTHLRNSISASYEDVIVEQIQLRLVIADDPTEQVQSVMFKLAPVSEDPTDPNSPVTEFEPVEFERTHVNQNIGRSRWIGRQLVRETTRMQGALLTLAGPGSYGVNFLDEVANREIVDQYNLDENEDGTVTFSLSDEPVILGSRLGSTSFGEQWQLEIAIADLGDWVETVNYVFEPGEGPAPLVSELPMQLTRTEGNLRVYTSPKFSFNGNPTGNNVGGIVYLYGTGTRSTAGTAKQKAELL